MGGGCLPALACLFSSVTAAGSLALPTTFAGSRGDEGHTDGLQESPGSG